MVRRPNEAPQRYRTKRSFDVLAASLAHILFAARKTVKMAGLSEVFSIEIFGVSDLGSNERSTRVLSEGR